MKCLTELIIKYTRVITSQHVRNEQYSLYDYKLIVTDIKAQ